MARKTEAVDEISEMERRADEMLQEIQRKSKEAEASRGRASREALAPLRERLVSAKRELLALVPQAKRLHALGLKYLAPGVDLPAATRDALRGRFLPALAGLLNGGKVHGCDEIIQFIDNTKSDNPSRLKQINNLAAGPLSGPGAVKEALAHVAAIASNPIVKTTATHEVPEHPAVIADEQAQAAEREPRVLMNIPRDDA